MSLGRIFNGEDWADIPDSGFGHTGSQSPVLPVLNGDGKVFVSIPSYRDGPRCAKTIVDLFAKATNPDQIVVGLIESNAEDDTFCLEAYCKEMGVDIYDKKRIRADTTKIIASPQKEKCPKINQIRNLAFHHIDAKGPMYARSMTRKLLGNEEFCLQIDDHMQFAKGWDELLKKEWASTGNEFAIISTLPAGLDEKNEKYVPRQCAVEFADIGIPAYKAHHDGKVEDLQKPLLSHAWSAGFSFSKCHLEETAPYDPFAEYVMGAEQFARFARFWTRGYDVYTPTQNIVFHDYAPNPDGHGVNEWMKNRRERLRIEAIARIKRYLELPGGTEGLNPANLGIYGLGKRRTLKQMAEFIGIDMDEQRSRRDQDCAGHHWVPYDANISPVENLYDKPDNLDSQPEFPLRTQLTFYKEEEQPALSLQLGDGDVLSINELEQREAHPSLRNETAPVHAQRGPSGALLLLLWIVGLIGWCILFTGPKPAGSKTSKTKRKKAGGTAKDK